jgi:lysophospholipase L1-like esterase
MKSILVFGDNLTWGFDPVDGTRYPSEDRWPTVLQRGLGVGAEVIAEGLAGRTTAFDDHTGLPDRNGARTLPISLCTHTPIDAIILMLGNSELRTYVSNAIGAAQGMRRLIEIVRTFPYQRPYTPPTIVIIAPPRLVPTKAPELGAMFEGGVMQSERLAEHYERLALDVGATYFDAATVATMSPIDGAHLDVENTRALGRALVPVLQRVLCE